MTVVEVMLITGQLGEGTDWMFSFQLSVMVWVLLPVFLVSGDPQADPLMSGCVRRARNSSLVVISPSVLSSVLAGAGSDCRHCFTLLDNDQPILQVSQLHSPSHPHDQDDPSYRVAGRQGTAVTQTVSSAGWSVTRTTPPSPVSSSAAARVNSVIASGGRGGRRNVRQPETSTERS